MRFYLFLVLSITLFLVPRFCQSQSFCNSSDSLSRAITLHQSSQFKEALPILIDLSVKFKQASDFEKYTLCQLKIADIIKNYGGVNTAIELLSANEKLLLVKLEKPTLVFAQNYLAKAEALHTAIRLSEFKEAVLQSIRIKRQLQLPEKYLAEDYLHLARYYKDSPNQNDSCYYWLQKSLKLAKSDRLNSIYLLPKIYNLYGYYYHPASIAYFINKRDSLMMHFKLSRKYYDSALMMVRNQTMQDELMPAKVYHNLGNSYSNEAGVDNNMQLLRQAIVYYNRSLETYNKFGSPSDIALKDWVIGKAYERLQLYDSAISQYQKGINHLVPSSQVVNKNELPSFQATLNNTRFITLVTSKAGVYFFKYKQTQDLSELLLAHEHYKYALRFIQYLLSQSTEEQDITYWNYLYGSNSYHQLLITAYELQRKTKNKTYLIESYGLIVSGKYAFLNKNDIDPIITKQIRSSLLYDEIKLVKENIRKDNSSLTEADLNAIFPELPLLNSIQSTDETKVPNHRLEAIGLEELQHALDKESKVLIDFYIWGKEFYTLIISPKEITAIKQILPDNFNSTIWKLKQNMLQSKAHEYANDSHSIYLETLDSALQHVPQSTNKLVVCPDGIFQDIPWDALVTDTTNTRSFKELNYLLYKFNIQSVLSPRHLLAQGKTRSGFYGVAADFTSSKRFSSIPFSTELVKAKASELNGSFSQTLINDSLNVNILHAAVHVVNDSLRPYNSSLFFNDTESINISELSNSNIRPRLAILNGCQTGSGTYFASEGMISFARAFYRLQAESVLMTIWSVDDKATSELINGFYSSMEEGDSLDYALNQAKVNFIKDAATDELANPYYWAGLQLTGKSTPIFEEATSLKYFIGIAGLAIFVMLYIIRMKAKRE